MTKTSDSLDGDEWQEVTGRKQRGRGRSKPQAALEPKIKTHIGYWKEVCLYHPFTCTNVSFLYNQILLITSAPPDHPVEIREVPRGLDWIFADSYPPLSESRRHYASLSKVCIIIVTTYH